MVFLRAALLALLAAVFLWAGAPGAGADPLEDDTEAPSAAEEADGPSADGDRKGRKAGRKGGKTGRKTAAAPSGPVSVFDLPTVLRGRMFAAQQAVSGNYGGAADTLKKLAERFPEMVELHLAQGVAAAGAGRTDEAFAALGAAVSRGFSNVGVLERDKLVAALRQDPRFPPLLAAARAQASRSPEAPAYLRRAKPGMVRNGKALVTPENTEWDEDLRMLRVSFEIPPVRGNRPVVARKGRPFREINAILNRLYLRGRAAGNVSDLYDNRDRGHSSLNRKYFKQVTFVEYGAEARERGADYGANTGILFDKITFGNSSTAYLGHLHWRSQIRSLLTQHRGPQALYSQYANNHVYVYPGHRDYDSGRYGDLLPANTPYTFTSRGKSGSDRNILRGIALTLAALPPDAKERIRREGLISPTVQMLMRRAYASDESDAAYMAPETHPSVFEPDSFDFQRLLRLAQTFDADALPPMVELEVVDESEARPGVNLFSGGLAPRLFDTPSAIARVHRVTDKTYRMTVSAAGTRDPNGRPLRFHWRVIQGDPSAIRITPGDDRGTTAEIEIDWHDPGDAPGVAGMKVHRVDLAVFADNGAQISAPAFISLAFPFGQAREYLADGRPGSIAYPWWRIDNREVDGAYMDMRMFRQQGWTDTYSYADDGRPTGWTRSWPDETRPPETYTPEGYRILETDARGRPTLAEAVRYRSRRENKARIIVDILPAGEWIEYAYFGPDDRKGRRSRRTSPPEGQSGESTQ